MFIDPRNSKVTVWLVKFPHFISRELRDLTPGTPIGTLEIPQSDFKPTSILYKPSKELLETGIPSDYKVHISNVNGPMYVLKHDTHIGKIEGSVDKECAICPVINKEYIVYKRRSSIISLKRSSQTIPNTNAKFMDKIGNVKELESLARKRKKMLQDRKRERLDKNEVMDIIFRAFETNESWTAKELGDFSGQPLAYINELLPEICTMNKKDQRNMWQLKDEYKCQKR